eukprot:COSAG06_NODE_38735_length_420_cov_0.928349_2_plen_104_part_00
MSSLEASGRECAEANAPAEGVPGANAMMQVGGPASSPQQSPKDVGWVEAASPAAARLGPTAGCGSVAAWGVRWELTGGTGCGCDGPPLLPPRLPREFHDQNRR